MTYRLGLDIGTGSIGFALVKFTGEREGEILLAGSHLFDSSEQQGKVGYSCRWYRNSFV